MIQRIAVFFILSSLLSCQVVKQTLTTCPQKTELPSGKVIGTIRVTESDCGDRRKQNHHYLVEFIQFGDGSFKTFLLGYTAHQYRLDLNLDSTSFFFTSMPPGVYGAKLLEGNTLWGYRGVKLCTFRIKEGQTTYLGKINVESPCWIESKSKASISITPPDSTDIEVWKGFCRDLE